MEYPKTSQFQRSFPKLILWVWKIQFRFDIDLYSFYIFVDGINEHLKGIWCQVKSFLNDSGGNGWILKKKTNEGISFGLQQEQNSPHDKVVVSQSAQATGPLQWLAKHPKCPAACGSCVLLETDTG